MIIRAITKEDVHSCIALGQDMHNESAYSAISFDSNSLVGVAYNVLNDPNWFGAVAVKEDQVIGMMIGFISEYWFSNEKFASDLCVYIVPEYRGSSAALRLMNLYTKWAVSKPIREIRIGETTRVNPEATAKFYKKLGFVEGGTLFVRPVH